MAAVVEFRVYTGSGASTESDPVTGVDWISADNADNDLTNRQANPVAVGTSSYEKWVKAIIETVPANALANFKVWSQGVVDVSAGLDFTVGWITGQTPTNSDSTIADTDFEDYTAGNKADWFAGPISFTGDETPFFITQLDVAADHAAGARTQEIMTFSWDET